MIPIDGLKQKKGEENKTYFLNMCIICKKEECSMTKQLLGTDEAHRCAHKNTDLKEYVFCTMDQSQKKIVKADVTTSADGTENNKYKRNTR